MYNNSNTKEYFDYHDLLGKMAEQTHSVIMSPSNLTKTGLGLLITDPFSR